MPARTALARNSRSRGACWLALVYLLEIGCVCGEPAPHDLPAAGRSEESSQSAAAVTSTALTEPAPTLEEAPGIAVVDGHLVLTQAEDVAKLAFASDLESLEVNLEDATAQDGSQADPCSQLDAGRMARLLPHLRHLKIVGCSRVLSHELTQFAGQLEALELQDLAVEGNLWQLLSELPKLRSLTISRVRAENRPFQSATPVVLPELRELALQELSSRTPLDRLVAFAPNLTHLTLQGSFAGRRLLDFATHATELERLDLHDTSISSLLLDRLAVLPHLRILAISQPRKPDLLFRGLRNLKLVQFECECPELGARGIKYLKEQTHLERVELVHVHGEDALFEALAQLPRLESLTLRSADLPANVFEALSAAPNLRELSCLGGSLADVEATGLEKLRHLERLALHLKDFGNEAAPHLAELTSLHALDLGHSSISDRGLAFLSNLTALEQLSLNHTRITSVGLGSLSLLTRLRVLHLDHTDVVDQGVRLISDLKQLRELRLDHTYVTDRGIAYLTGLDQLTVLGLAGTVVTDKGAAALREFPRLRAVDLRDSRVSGANDAPADEAPNPL